MSNPVGAQRYGLGGGDAYYDAVKYGGYTGTREQFGRDQAEFAQNATAVAQAREEVERNTQTVVDTAQTFTEETVPAAIQSVEEKGDTEEDRLELRTTELVEAVNTAGAVQVQAVRDEGTTQIGLVSDAGIAQVEAVEQAGSDQIDAVELAGSTQVGNVNSAGTTQVGNVNQAGTTQVGNVNTAGAAQVQAVEDKGEEVLNSIPADYSDLTEEVDNLNSALTQQSDAFDTEYIRGSVVEIKNGALGKASIDVYDGTTPTVYICGENFVNTSGETVTGSSYSTIVAILQAYTDSGKYVKGKYINSSGGLSNNPNYVVYVCPAVPNRTMYFMSDDNTISGVAIVDSSGTVLKYATVGWQKYYDIDIPSDGAYAMLGYSGITLQAGLTFAFGKYTDIQKLSSPYSEAMINNGYNAIWASPSANLRVGYKSALPPELVKNVIGTKVNFTLQNGTPPNSGNTYAVGSKEFIPLKTGDIFQVKCDKPLSASGNYYQLQINYYDSTQTRVAWYDLVDIDKVYKIEDSNVSYVRIGLFEFTSDGEHVTLRITSFLDNSEVYVIQYEPSSWVLNYPEMLTARKANNHEVNLKILNAKHATTPLSILHFSDLHADVAALRRIMEDEATFTSIDDAICTGDIVGNTYANITSWWNPSVMTCIGNHDTASYSDGAYNWTALSMADRDAYYIAPFEANWGITHTSGTSYYYKDYPTQKVRLIVMDVMLYKDNGAEATAQTAWLENLLADAITNNLHVLIAIHTAHGGATAEECSFSRYNQGVMPTYNDCNTPQTVIDAVSAKITSGLKFVGYICGHTHQDNIWDAENDGKQLMYCVTCASTSSAQWAKSDQHRDADNDAYNIVVVDTTNTLVKLVRGGGADIDDHMRTRKAICFNYSTGQMVGEVL